MRFGTRILFSTIAFATLSGSYLFAETQPDGKGLFLAAGCDGCHSVKAADIALADPEALNVEEDEVAPPDLSTVASRHDAEFLHGFLVKKEKIDGRKHMKRFKGTDEERATLVAWLVALEAAK